MEWSMEAPAQDPSVDTKMTSATGGHQDKESDYTETYSEPGTVLHGLCQCIFVSQMRRLKDREAE